MTNFKTQEQAKEEARSRLDSVQGPWMFALWEVKDGEVHFYRASWKFPKEDMQIALGQLRSDLSTIPPVPPPLPPGEFLERVRQGDTEDFIRVNPDTMEREEPFRKEPLAELEQQITEDSDDR